jgi:Ca2+-binding RTX toxin-like protein
MNGGGGDDTFIVDNTRDSVTESENSGTDLVQSSVSYRLSDHIENLTLMGNAVITGSGNALGNVLTGNGKANSLWGLDGSDTMYGGAGHDTSRWLAGDPLAQWPGGLGPGQLAGSGRYPFWPCPEVRRIVCACGGIHACGSRGFGRACSGNALVKAATPPSAVTEGPVKARLSDHHHQLIDSALAACGGNISHAARTLGVSRGVLYRHLRTQSALAQKSTAPPD